MSLPLVSIVIPSYKPGYFEQCLRSALGQTYQNIEVLVSDNCPTEAIREICARYPGVIYQRSSATRASNILAALYGAKGEFIKPLFDDDILHPFCVERMVTAMHTVADAELVFAASAVIDKDNAIVRRRAPYPQSGVMDGVDLYRTLALVTNVVGEFTSLMVRRQRLWDIGTRQIFTLADYDYLHGLCDVAFYCRVAHGRRAYYLNEELSYFRLDMRLESNSNPATSLDYGGYLSDGLEILRGAHIDGVITTEELLGTRARALEASRQHAAYPEMRAAYQHYSDYLLSLGQSPQPE